MQRTYTLMIAQFPGNQSVHPESAGYVTRLALETRNDLRIGQVIPWKMSDTPITMSRNKAVKDALSMKADYLLMIDADMHPDVVPGSPKFWDRAWNFLMARRRVEQAWYDEGTASQEMPPATIAAPYCSCPPDEGVNIFQWATSYSNQTGSPHDQPFRLTTFSREEAARRVGIEEVAALPTGLILYDMRVFERLPKPWFDYEWDDPEQTIKASTEDVYQTRNASLLGMPQYVVWDSWAGHIKLKTVGKPSVLTVDCVKSIIKEAIRKDYHAGEGVRMLGNEQVRITEIEMAHAIDEGE